LPCHLLKIALIHATATPLPQMGLLVGFTNPVMHGKEKSTDIAASPANTKIANKIRGLLFHFRVTVTLHKIKIT